MQDNQLLTVKEVAAELKVSERWVTKQIKQGKLEAIDLGKGFRIYRSDLDDYIARLRTKRE